MTHLAVVRVWKRFRRYAPPFGNRNAVTGEAARMIGLRPHVFRIGARLLNLLVAIRAARALTGLELKAIWRIAYRNNPKIRRQGFAMSLVREGIVEVACLRFRENTRPQRLVASGNSSCFVTDTTKAAWLAHCGFEELSGEIVAAYAGNVRKPLRHRLIGSRGLSLNGNMTISAYDLEVFLLVVGKTTTPGSIPGLLN